MDIVHVVAVLLALVGATPAVTLLSPVKVAHRAVPGIMIIASLVLWFLPTGIDLALACVPVAAWISARLGIEHAGHEAADYSGLTPAVERAKSAAQAVRGRVRKPQEAEPVEITEFVTRAYPNPDDPDEDELLLADTDAVADDDLDDNKTITQVPKYVPAL
jgi:hypothetical protein